MKQNDNKAYLSMNAGIPRELIVVLLLENFN